MGDDERLMDEGSVRPEGQNGHSRPLEDESAQPSTDDSGEVAELSAPSVKSLPTLPAEEAPPRHLPAERTFPRDARIGERSRPRPSTAASRPRDPNRRRADAPDKPASDSSITPAAPTASEPARPDEGRRQREALGEMEIPASLIFMEMMRQAASVQPTTPPLDVPPALRLPPAEQPTEDVPTPAREAVGELAEQEAVPAEVVSPDENSTEDVEADDSYNQMMEIQRVRRMQRRRARRRQRTVSTLGGIVRSLVVVIISAALMATILSWFIDPKALDPELRASLQVVRATGEAPVAMVPTALSTPNWMLTIGIVSGHYGPENDPGAICMENGVVTLTENAINFSVASRVVTRLRSLGYNVDLLDEWDPRLQNYQGAALVSIHANTCQDFGEVVSGYLVAQHEARPEGGDDSRLRECIAMHYEAASGLERRFGLTRDMTDYHIFREINGLTPGVILELGFMLHDRAVLTDDPDLLAEGVTNGLLCFLQPDSPYATPPEATAAPGI